MDRTDKSRGSIAPDFIAQTAFGSAHPYRVVSRKHGGFWGPAALGSPFLGYSFLDTYISPHVILVSDRMKGKYFSIPQEAFPTHKYGSVPSPLPLPPPQSSFPSLSRCPEVSPLSRGPGSWRPSISAASASVKVLCPLHTVFPPSRTQNLPCTRARCIRLMLALGPFLSFKLPCPSP